MSMKTLDQIQAEIKRLTNQFELVKATEGYRKSLIKAISEIELSTDYDYTIRWSESGDPLISVIRPISRSNGWRLIDNGKQAFVGSLNACVYRAFEIAKQDRPGSDVGQPGAMARIANLNKIGGKFELKAAEK